MSDNDERLQTLIGSVVDCDEERLPLLTLHEARVGRMPGAE
ncbi:hypothetical protein [Streptomyces sp. YGL11-2]